MKHSEIDSLTALQIDRKVKIQGTKYDRKVKYTKKQVGRMNKLYASYGSIRKVAKEMGIPYSSVYYYISPEYHEKCCHRPGSHDHGYISAEERGEYKRDLLKRGCKVINVNC